MTNSRRSFLNKAALAVAATAATPFASFGKGYEDAINNTPKLSAPSDLKITDVKCAFIRNGNSLFVKIHTNQGIYGCGEGVDAVGGSYHLVQRMGRFLKDQSPLNVHRLFEQLRK